MTEKPLEQMGLRELRAIARQQMPAEAWHHFNGAAESKATFYRNPRYFSKISFSPASFSRHRRPGYHHRALRSQAAYPGGHCAGGKFQFDRR